MPAEHRLRLDEQGRPRGSRHPLTQCRHHYPIAGTPSNLLDLAFQDLHLPPKDQHLRLQPGLVLLARRDDV
jgi:hypothetical protein